LKIKTLQKHKIFRVGNVSLNAKILYFLRGPEINKATVTITGMISTLPFDKPITSYKSYFFKKKKNIRYMQGFSLK
jgi:hypothetical protein